MNQIIALADCNNFYASCERVFQPKLRGKPVIVLSNNDGCVIARSNEAKTIGIQMGQAFFECKTLIQKHRIAVFSSNFALYGDFSNRVMQTLARFTPNLEIYSVDEAFLDLNDLPYPNLADYSKTIRTTVLKSVGIPVSIGIAPTKTLAKVANRIAKKYPQYGGVFDITNHPKTDRILESLDTGDIWGIGRKTRKFLAQYGIMNALQFKNQPDEWIKKNLSICGLRTVHELRGIPSIELEETGDEPQKSIITSRSFKHAVTTIQQLKEAVATFVSRATEKLREQSCVAAWIQVYVGSGHYKHDRGYWNSHGMPLPHSTAATPDFIQAAHECLNHIFKHGYGYKKAGVILTKITPKKQQQLDLFTPLQEYRHKESLMQVMDQTNLRWGSDTLKYAATGLEQPWRSKQEKRSPNYTTQWDQLLTIKV